MMVRSTPKKNIASSTTNDHCQRIPAWQCTPQQHLHQPHRMARQLRQRQIKCPAGDRCRAPHVQPFSHRLSSGGHVQLIAGEGVRRDEVPGAGGGQSRWGSSDDHAMSHCRDKGLWAAAGGRAFGGTAATRSGRERPGAAVRGPERRSGAPRRHARRWPRRVYEEHRQSLTAALPLRWREWHPAACRRETCRFRRRRAARGGGRQCS